jgi:cytoskeletal protein CcmA (bactofilin family)
MATPVPEARLIGWREIRTFLDPGTQVTGKLSFTTPTRIEGRLRGEVRASDLLVVARGGVLQGTVWPRSLIVAGEVRGQILGAERVEIQPGGRVAGLIETRSLIVAEGAMFEGDCRVAEEDAAVLGEPARV